MRVQQVRKVRRQRRPGYPTRPEVARDPELLRRHVPSAWKKSAQVTAALSIMLASAHAQDAIPKKAPLKIAPIFEHGEGFGSEGCIIITPPRFLAEEEALRIITEELAKAGIPAPLKDEVLPQMFIQKCRDGRLDEGRRPFIFDFYEPTKRIAIEYVSYKDDNLLLSGNEKWLGGSVTPRNFVKAAEWVRKEIQKNESAPDVYYGILYDPAPLPQEPDSTFTPIRSKENEKAGIDAEAPRSEQQRKRPSIVGVLNSPEAKEERRVRAEDWKKRHDEDLRIAFNKSSNLLRAQVRDFIEWLKGQGAI